MAGATAAAEALVQLHPLREAPVRTLALARRRAGQPAGAIRAIADFRQRLAEETGLDPTPELLALERELLTNDASPEQVAHRQLRGYELTELVAQGAFGSVYRATQPSIGREVAIKVVRPELANNRGSSAGSKSRRRQSPDSNIRTSFHELWSAAVDAGVAAPIDRRVAFHVFVGAASLLPVARAEAQRQFPDHAHDADLVHVHGDALVTVLLPGVTRK